MFSYTPLSKRQLAGTRYRKIRQTTEALSNLHAIPDDILEEMTFTRTDIQALRKDFTQANLSCSKTFTVCHSCFKALKGKHIRKDAKNFSDYDCNICNTPSKLTYSSTLHKATWTNHKIQHSTNLKIAKAYCIENFPELFL